MATPALSAPTEFQQLHDFGGSWLSESLADMIRAVRCARLSRVVENVTGASPARDRE